MHLLSNKCKTKTNQDGLHSSLSSLGQPHEMFPPGLSLLLSQLLHRMSSLGCACGPPGEQWPDTLEAKEIRTSGMGPRNPISLQMPLLHPLVNWADDGVDRLVGKDARRRSAEVRFSTCTCSSKAFHGPCLVGKVQAPPLGHPCHGSICQSPLLRYLKQPGTGTWFACSKMFTQMASYLNVNTLLHLTLSSSRCF